MNLTIFETFSGHPVVTALGWSLVHFIWQATVIGLIVGLVLLLMKRSSAKVTYAISCAGMLVMVAVPLATLAYLLSSSDLDEWRTGRATIAMTQLTEEQPPIEMRIGGGSSTNAGSTSDVNLKSTTIIQPNHAGEGSVALLPDKSIPLFASQLQRWLPWCVALWVVGVLLLATRLLFGLGNIHRWRRDATEICIEKLTQPFARLARQMKVSHHVRLLESARTATPAVIGWFRPVVLVPASMISGLTTLELEAILAHELAHIRRHDYLINLLQTLVETVLFYHPAVWWLSNRIRIEREHCCDDIAVGICGDRVVFVTALARMEELRCNNERLAIAANGGSLVGRIRRLIAGEPACAASWWPAGAMALGAMAMLGVGLLIADVAAKPANPVENRPESIGITDDDKNENDEKDEKGKKYQTRKNEVKKTDSKTGIEKHVFTDINLSNARDGKPAQASVDMMYSNVMMYSFIPARIAKQLGAVELGEIDFGEKAPPRPKPFQSALAPFELKPGPAKEKKPDVKTCTVKELVEPAGDVKVVPYGNEAIWIPSHLGFYGMNQTKQHVFKIVRIGQIDLGIGPAFGPINALVLDDDNSEFGVIGRDWTKRVRGENGETLWHAAVGGFHLMARPKSVPAKEPSNEEGSVEPSKASQSGNLKVESTGHSILDPQTARRSDVKVLKSHTYNLSRRESTGWIELKGSNVPIDVGVEHDGLIVYMTLFNDIVAVEAENKKVVWDVPWFKTTPFWQTVSIVEVTVDGEKKTAVELFAAKGKTGEVVYRYYSVKNGEPIELPLPEAAAETSTTSESTESDSDDDLPKIQIAEKDGDRVTHAFAKSIGKGRSPVELLKHFEMIFDRHGSPERAGSVTNMESIVSAHPNYLLGDAMDANEVNFSLPEGSGTRGSFSGERVEIRPGKDAVEIVITNGRVEILDSVGVVRATATPDGGAEQLVINCRMANDEVDMLIKTKRLVDDPDYPNPPVQVKMNTETGAPNDESDPPHGAVRYSILPEDKEANKPARMKMKWRYDMRRLAEEAEAQAGKSWEEILGYEKSESDETKTETKSQANRLPWAAKGRVMDADGKPIRGAVVRAHCGAGTLRETGSAITNADGKYELLFGPGIWSEDRAMVQAATISVHLDGHFERNLHRQGDLLAAFEKPEGEIGWSGKTIEDVFLPDQPKEIDFVLLPSTSIRGVVIDENGKPGVGLRISLTGDELPPSSSVVANTKSNEKGEFEINDLPTGFKFQILVEPAKAEPPWLAWAGAPFVFLKGDTDDTHIEYSVDQKQVDFSCQHLHLILKGKGTNWKTALKQAAEQELKLKWNGLASEEVVRAGVAWLELGG